MKKGKTSKLKLTEFAKINYGTVDSKNLNSVYVNLQTWVQPKLNHDNWERVVLNLSRGIRHTIHDNINNEVFDDNFIVDLDLRSSGIQPDKKSFMNLEINFFIRNSAYDFKSPLIKKSIEDTVSGILSENFIKNNYFSFYSSKNE